MAVEVIALKDLMILGEITDGIETVAIKHPISIQLLQKGSNELVLSTMVYPVAVDQILDDISNHTVYVGKKDILFRGKPSDKLADAYITGANKYRNIAVPTVGQVIDIEASK
jgi:hypothetical protein